MTMQSERMARVEEQVNQLREDMIELKSDVKDLLTLRSRGVGAFWLAATLIGTGIVGGFVQFLHYIGLTK